MYNYEFSRTIFKLVLVRCAPVAGLESGFVFHYARPFITLDHSLRSACNFMVSEKLKLIRGMLNPRHIYNKQITTYKMLYTDFYSRVAKL